MFFIRTPSVQDVPKIRELLVETWHATYDVHMGAQKVTKITDQWHALDRLKANLNRPNSEFVIADNGTRIGGMAFATQHEKTVSLHQLYVAPDCQGQGVGLDLLLEIENAFPDCDRISLEVDMRNEKAISFYRAQGFAIAREIKDCGQKGSEIPAYVMEKPIIFVD